jgi:hypothetical protein
MTQKQDKLKFGKVFGFLAVAFAVLILGVAGFSFDILDGNGEQIEAKAAIVDAQWVKI